MGNLGIAIITVMHMSYLLYFFAPPKGVGIPYFLPQENFIIGLTLFGIIVGLGKVIDAFLDPAIANFSDRLNHPLGKRIPLMRFAALPFALCYLLVFFVPDAQAGTLYNGIWLAILLLLSAIFFTTYMIPYYSLMVDLARTSDDKVDLGTISSAFWFAGFIILMFAPGLWDLFAEIFNTSRLSGLQITFSILAVLGFASMLVTAYMLKPEDYMHDGNDSLTKQQALLPSLKKVLKNYSFRNYLVANMFYTTATIIFESGLIYFITVLALMDASLQGPLSTVIGAATLLCYPLVNKACKAKSKSYVLKVSFLLFSLTFMAVTLFGIDGIHIYLLFAIVILLTPFSQAAFGILPHVVTADCAAYDQHKTDKDNTGMYMAANGFSTKVGVTLGFVLLPSFLLFGKDVGQDMGIRIAAMFGAVITLLSIYFMSRYDEDEIQAYAHGPQASQPN